MAALCACIKCASSLPTETSDTMFTNRQNLPVLSVEGWRGLWLPKMFILVLRFYRENELPLNPHWRLGRRELVHMQYRLNLQETGGWADLMQGWEKEMQLWRGLIYKQQLISVGLKHEPDVNDESSVS